MIWNTLRRALGLDPNDRALRKYEGVVEQINELSENLESRSEDELRAMGARLRERARDGEPLEELLVEVFALVREVSRRTIGLRHYDVQLIGMFITLTTLAVKMCWRSGRILTAFQLKTWKLIARLKWNFYSRH